MFELFPHTADLGLRVRADDFEGLLADAALGLAAMIAEDAAGSGGERTVRLEIPGRRPDWLLFDWLNELLYLFETERLLPVASRLTHGPGGVTADVSARRFDPERERLVREVKAITYHGLRVERDADGWIAEVIVDI